MIIIYHRDTAVTEVNSSRFPGLLFKRGFGIDSDGREVGSAPKNGCKKPLYFIN